MTTTALDSITAHRPGRPRPGRFIAALVLALATAPAMAADSWHIDHDDSVLGFSGTQQGGEFEGRFEAFSAEMRFSPDDLDDSGFEVSIDVGSITTGSRRRDRELPGEDWFAMDRFPEATFLTREIREDGDGFEAVGELTIREHTREVVLPFQWTTDGNRATMTGETRIDRTSFGVGQGEWADADAVGHMVTVVVDLRLQRAD